jgi:Zn finger protein HypA/HybF involved in hydrogenase expression
VNKTVDDLVITNMTEFTDQARQQGTITKELYENMIRELDRTGELYDIDIEVSHPVSGAEIKEVKLGDKMPDIKAANTSYIQKELLGDEFKEEEQHEGHFHADEIRPFAAHTHTDACFAGHKHNTDTNSIDSCYAVIGGPGAHEHMENNTAQYKYSTTTYIQEDGWTRVYIIYIKCTKCIFNIGYVYHTVGPNSAGFQSQFHAMNNTGYSWYYGYDVHAPGIDPKVAQFNSIYNGILAGESNDSLTKKMRLLSDGKFVPNVLCVACASNFTTGNAVHVWRNVGDVVLTCNQAVGTMMCDKVVTSITPTNPNQTVNKGSNIVTTANATYLDGHTAVINCTSNFNPNQLGVQTVTLTYYGLVDNARTNGTKTCTVNVTVKDPFKLSGLTASPASQEIYRYQSPSFSVTANYDNGTSKPVTGYSISNYNSSTLGTQTVTITYSESGITKSATANVIVRNLTRVCPICHTGYYLDNNDKDPGCPYCKSTIVTISASPDNIVLNKGKPLNITVEATYRNGSRSIVTGWTSNYDSTQVGIQDVTISYQTFTASIRVEVRNQLKTCSICSLEYELNNDGTDPGCPVCKKTVVSIAATPEVLTINKHQSLPITVKATFKDGHTEVVNDWASNNVADTAGIYEVMILYQNVMDIITVTVMEDGQIECPYCGLKYLFNDSPKGCPSCYVTLTGIEVSLRSGGTKVPYKSKLNLLITKLFKDEHRELTYTGWTVSDYNPGQLGNQTITAHYNGFSDQLDIEVVDDLPEVTCSNGHTYYLNADGSDPGCPYCSGIEDKEESLFYFDTTYTGFIVDAIYTNGEYPLEKGDYLKITIKPRNVSILSKLFNMFIGFLKREYTFGGEVS